MSIGLSDSAPHSSQGENRVKVTSSNLIRYVLYLETRSAALLSLILVVGALFVALMSISEYLIWSDRNLSTPDTPPSTSSGSPEFVETPGALHQVMQEILAGTGRVDDLQTRSSRLFPSKFVLHSIEFVYVGAFGDLILTLGPLLTRHSALSAEAITVQRPTPQSTEVEARVRLTLIASP